MFCVAIAFFQVNSIAISQDRRDSIKSFQLSKNICSKVSKKAYQILNNCNSPYLLKQEVGCNYELIWGCHPTNFTSLCRYLISTKPLICSNSSKSFQVPKCIYQMHFTFISMDLTLQRLFSRSQIQIRLVLFC